MFYLRLTAKFSQSKIREKTDRIGLLKHTTSKLSDNHWPRTIYLAFVNIENEGFASSVKVKH